MACDVLHERNGALADERHRYRMGAHALARDAAGGVGGVETGGSLSRTRKPGEPLLLPEDEALLVQMNRSPIIRANQAHPLNGRDCEAATIAGLPEAGSVPQLNRAITRKAALFNPVSNELSSDIWRHAPAGLHIGRSDQSALRYSDAGLTAQGRDPMRRAGARRLRKLRPSSRRALALRNQIRSAGWFVTTPSSRGPVLVRVAPFG
jgi:hypothetical protein